MSAVMTPSRRGRRGHPARREPAPPQASLFAAAPATIDPPSPSLPPAPEPRPDTHEGATAAQAPTAAATTATPAPSAAPTTAPTPTAPTPTAPTPTAPTPAAAATAAPATAAAVSSDTSTTARAHRQGPTLDDLVVGVWEGLLAGAPADCPACGTVMTPRHSAGAGVVGGRCGGCGSTLS